MYSTNVISRMILLCRNQIAKHNMSMVLTVCYTFFEFAMFIYCKHCRVNAPMTLLCAKLCNLFCFYLCNYILYTLNTPFLIFHFLLIIKYYNSTLTNEDNTRLFGSNLHNPEHANIKFYVIKNYFCFITF